MPVIRSTSGATRARKARCASRRAPRSPASGLPSRANAIVANMSHGEHRQLELAMALATRPRMLLLDEPMAGLGPEESARMVKTLRELKRELTILLIEHDMEAVFALADRITVLVYGRVIASGAPDAIRANAEVRQAYLGEQEAVSVMSEPLLQLDQYRDLLRAEPGAVRHLARHRARRDGDADGPQRHGQDHDRAFDHGTDAGARRLDPLRRRGDPRAAVLSRGAARHRAGAGGAAGVSRTCRAARTWSPPRPTGLAPPTRGRSTGCATCSPGLASGSAAWATSSPAASSRCWRSAAR